MFGWGTNGHVTDDTLIHHSSLSLILCTIETKTSMYSINDKRQWHMTCFGAAIQDWKMIKFQVPSTRVYLYLWTWTRAPHLRADKLASQHPVQRRYILHIATLGWPVQWLPPLSHTAVACDYHCITFKRTYGCRSLAPLVVHWSATNQSYQWSFIQSIMIKKRVGWDTSFEFSILLIPLLPVFLKN